MRGTWGGPLVDTKSVGTCPCRHDCASVIPMHRAAQSLSLLCDSMPCLLHSYSIHFIHPIPATNMSSLLLQPATHDFLCSRRYHQNLQNLGSRHSVGPTNFIFRYHFVVTNPQIVFRITTNNSYSFSSAIIIS